ncbi:LEM-3-like GIY-YIG domain-containing protein [Flagellimonas marinaquae]|uniref:LEM-3-like GIY-YIG domain-containing protein n=1 Tax=Flagellimonas marinaquae TaxID=254955 RepID=UPI000F8E94F9|nr:hypothetical protein [Allomuricauda aquimarina]
MFDEKTKSQLKYYVYLLIHPETDEPFYVGKGKDDRIFAHIHQEIDEENESLKYDEIQRIGPKNVKHVIVRHGLNETTAFAIEASLIDTFRFIPSFNKFTRGNIQGGINSIEKGLMTSDEIIALYNAAPVTRIGEDCIIININKNYNRGDGVDSIYLATKEIWKMADWRPKNYRYVLSEHRGLIREVFEVEEWYEKERTDRNGKPYIGFGFNGRVAFKDIRDRYIHKSIKQAKPRGYSSPIIYPETYMRWVRKN